MRVRVSPPAPTISPKTLFTVENAHGLAAGYVTTGTFSFCEASVQSDAEAEVAHSDFGR